jgi:hypothetical protein
MKASRIDLKCAAVVGLTLVALTGCESTDSGGSTHVSGSMYYGVGVYDPWYYGGYGYDDVDIIVTPPDRPARPAHPEQPIARPTPQPRPMPSMPAMPRGGGRR